MLMARRSLNPRAAINEHTCRRGQTADDVCLYLSETKPDTPPTAKRAAGEYIIVVGDGSKPLIVCFAKY